MPLIICEDTERVSKKRIPIPANAKKVFKAMEKLYGQYIDHTNSGRVLKRLARDKKNGEEDSISVNNAKVILSRQNRQAPNKLKYQLYGGQLANSILRRGVERSRGESSVAQVKPQRPPTPPSPTPTSSLGKSLKPNM